MKTIVVGLGNPILTDDGVGVKAAYEVKSRMGENVPESVSITEASLGGLRLMELLEGYDRAIIIDAIQTNNGHQPGTIFTMDLDDLRTISPTQHSASAHDTTLVTALDMGRKMGLSLPDDISIIAVEVENVLDFSEEPTPKVAQAIPLVAEAVLNELKGGL
jgi:hydrogenase maturation protease